MNHLKEGFLKKLEEQARVSSTEELIEKIEASNSLLKKYEEEINYLEVEQRRLNNEYGKSYDFDFVVNTKDLNSLVNYRDAIINKIIENNYILNDLKIFKEKQEKINSWLFKMYYFLNVF